MSKSIYILLSTIFISLNTLYSAISWEWVDKEGSKNLEVVITTERLFLRLVTEDDIPRIAELLGDEKVMEKLANGKSFSPEVVQARFKKRLASEQPHGAFMIFLQNPDKQIFLGIIALVPSNDYPGALILSYALHTQFWGNGYASEAVGALIHEYTPKLVEYSYLTKGHAPNVVRATVSPDNPGSYKILDKFEFTCLLPNLEVGGRAEEGGLDRYNIIDSLERVRTEGIEFGVLKWHLALDLRDFVIA